MANKPYVSGAIFSEQVYFSLLICSSLFPGNGALDINKADTFVSAYFLSIFPSAGRRPSHHPVSIPGTIHIPASAGENFPLPPGPNMRFRDIV